VELQNFQARKRLLDYDDVMNQQREVIYNLRSFALEGGEELKGEAEKLVAAAVSRRVETTLTGFETPQDWDLELLRQELLMPYLVRVAEFDSTNTAPNNIPEARQLAADAALKAFHEKFTTLGDFASRLLSLVMLNVLDEKWKDHLYDLDQLRSAIQYRSWGQKDPLIEYKHEAFSMFEDLMHDIQHTFTERFLKVQLVFEDTPRPPRPPATPMKFNALGVAEPVGEREAPKAPESPEPARAEPKVVGAGRGVTNLAAGTPNIGNVDFSNVGRNDPCPCGSGKKFKKCHGA
jgi:preprotein translocase subunit SecA